MEELLKNLKDVREKNKKEFEKRKIVAKEILDEAEHTVLLVTESKNAILGNTLDIMTTLSRLFEVLLKEKILDESEIIKLLAIVKGNLIEEKTSDEKFIEKIKKIMKDLGVKYE